MNNLKLFLVGLLLSLFSRNIYAQYIPTIEDLLINDVDGEFEPHVKTGGIYDFYNNLRTWIPYCDAGYPLKNPPITYIELSFHVFLDDNGGNNDYTNTPEGRSKLMYIFDVVNDIYSGDIYNRFPPEKQGPSAPVPGVQTFSNYVVFF